MLVRRVNSTTSTSLRKRREEGKKEKVDFEYSMMYLFVIPTCSFLSTVFRMRFANCRASVKHYLN